MSPLDYLEYSLGRLLSSNRGRDSKLWTNTAAFADAPEVLTVTCPEIGPSNSVMPVEYGAFGKSRFPAIEWKVSPTAPAATADEIKQYIVLIEDPDAPLPLVPIHGLFYAIPDTKTTITADDLALDTDTKAASRPGEKYLRGGFRLGKNIRGTIYGAPRPPLGHGPHRYFYQVVALNDKLNVDKLSPVATKTELENAIKSKIVGYGVWVGVFERKWE
ncbi:hypothetical protein PV08_01408 [Exophiala spinifera]|uniref:YbhB/YbcL family Raf kinase inhibitor-like protein n=1 Tax=Exophiala spinifera TaxID=91928 RepID=A0A0D2BQT2_9EURO|nr:uncharacterized protein PV08_01408 [Exophiala spinifera]KIW20830.1 hypothetical protein PV08_01408 [Exophiala spinifera]